MSYTLETISITSTARLLVVVDDDAQNPREDWSMITGVINVDRDSRSNDIPEVHPCPAPLSEAWLYWVEGENRARYNYEAERPGLRLSTPYHRRHGTVERWARIFHGLTVEHHDGALWFCEPGEMAANWPELQQGSAEYVAKEREVISQEVTTYRAWAEGEAVGVVLERLAMWARVDADLNLMESEAGDQFDTRTDWEEVEAIWGCYLDREYSAQAIAADCFPLTAEELAILTPNTLTEKSAA